ncbi:uncharacterized protein [Typha latifolia]|uniref:uncharacterized protein n=1 Tax=Typha latifolia TaxID=4733 RepID=UPI003C2F3894
MAEKISTIVLKVDLDCHLCYKKIRKILCKLQEKENIKTISYDDKNKTVTISGPFDAKKISGKLTCKAGKVIKEIQIKENKENKEKEKEKEKEKPKDTKPAEKEKPKPAKPEKETKPAEPATKPKGDAEPAKAKPKAEGEPAKAKPAAKKAEPDQPKAEPVMVVQSPMGWPAGPVCCCRPSYEAYYGGGRCCSCGMAYGCMGGAPQGFYGGAPQGYNRNCQYICEEDPTSCSIM